MADIKQAYGGSTSITCSLAGLANTASRASTAIDNSSNKYRGAKVEIVVKTGASGTSSTGTVVVYMYETVNGTYTEGATGSDAAITLTSPTNLTQLGLISTPANSTSYTKVFETQGSLANSWGIVVTNSSGAALDATEGSHIKVYQGLYDTVA